MAPWPQRAQLPRPPETVLAPLVRHLPGARRGPEVRSKACQDTPGPRRAPGKRRGRAQTCPHPENRPYHAPCRSHGRACSRQARAGPARETSPSAPGVRPMSAVHRSAWSSMGIRDGTTPRADGPQGQSTHCPKTLSGPKGPSAPLPSLRGATRRRFRRVRSSPACLDARLRPAPRHEGARRVMRLSRDIKEDDQRETGRASPGVFHARLKGNPTPPTRKTGWPMRTKSSDKADATTRNVRAIIESTDAGGEKSGK